VSPDELSRRLSALQVALLGVRSGPDGLLRLLEVQREVEALIVRLADQQLYTPPSPIEAEVYRDLAAEDEAERQAAYLRWASSIPDGGAE
jgi:hypothetical protein